VDYDLVEIANTERITTADDRRFVHYSSDSKYEA